MQILHLNATHASKDVTRILYPIPPTFGQVLVARRRRDFLREILDSLIYIPLSVQVFEQSREGQEKEFE